MKVIYTPTQGRYVIQKLPAEGHRWEDYMRYHSAPEARTDADGLAQLHPSDGWRVIDTQEDE